VQSPSIVRPPCAWRVSCPLQVQTPTDPLTDRAERFVAVLLLCAVGSQKGCAEAGNDLLKLLAGEAVVGEHGVAVQRDASEHLGGDNAPTDVGGGQLKDDRHAIGRAQQVQPKAPDIAAVRGARVMAGLASQLRAAGGFARLAVRHRVLSSSRRRSQPATNWSPGASAPWRSSKPGRVCACCSCVGKYANRCPSRQRANARKRAVFENRQEHLREGQRDELSIRDLRSTALPLASIRSGSSAVSSGAGGSMTS
jgi:hypothetical protein